MNLYLLILLLAAPAIAQQPSRQPAPTTAESVAEIRKIISRYEANVKRSGYDLACAKEYTEHGSTPDERRLIVTVCGGDEAAILPVSDAEYILQMNVEGLRKTRQRLQLLLGPSRLN